MSTRLAPWPSRNSPQVNRKSNSRPELKVIEGGKTPRLERFSPRTRLVGLAAMVAIVLFGVTAFHVVLSQGQFRLEKVQAKAATAQDDYERLRLQVAQLESPARITSEAQDRLGMVAPDKVTPVAPNAADMPKAPVSSSGTASPPSAADAGDWDKVKPQLNSSSK